MPKLNFSHIDKLWLPIIKEALKQVDQNYLLAIEQNKNWLPGHNNLFNAFSLPLSQTKFILFGESPYPREQSANGYAFWDAAVNEVWSMEGLSKAVNRATSLRNIIKMLLIAENLLSTKDTSQAAIAAINKGTLIQTMSELFYNFRNHGFLLLNASLVLSINSVKQDAMAWKPFINKLLLALTEARSDIQLILFGNIAKAINDLPSAKTFRQIHAEHPYNLSFITNQKVIDFFKNFGLLRKDV